MPANPGKSRSAEKQKKKRAAAQQVRKEKMARARARAEAEQAEAANAPQEELEPQPFPSAQGEKEVDFDALDKGNDEIKALIKKKALDDAEKKARELAKRFPRHSDGLQRLAEIQIARGDKAKALETLREALKRPNDGDEEVADEIEAAIAKLSK